MKVDNKTAKGPLFYLGVLSKKPPSRKRCTSVRVRAGKKVSYKRLGRAPLDDVTLLSKLERSLFWRVPLRASSGAAEILSAIGF